MSVKQDLTDHPIEVEGPEAVFMRMLAEEQGLELPEDAPVPKPEPKANSDQPEETEEELEEEEAPAEEESDDPEEESDDLPEQATEEPVTDEDVHDVVVNGETVQVSYEELRNGYSREADYTRRTQEMGEEQRQLGVERDAVLAERQRYDGLLGQLQEVVEQSLPQEPDWTQVREQTPDQFPAIYAEWTQRKGQLDKIKVERERVAQAAATDLANAAEAQAVEERTKLKTALPALFEEETAAGLSQSMLETAQTYGYTPEDVSAIRDSRALRLLHDATQYRLLQTKGKTVTKRAKPTPTVAPGAKKTSPTGRASRRRQAEQRLKKSGSVEDAAAVFLQPSKKRA